MLEQWRVLAGPQSQASLRGDVEQMTSRILAILDPLRKADAALADDDVSMAADHYRDVLDALASQDRDWNVAAKLVLRASLRIEAAYTVHVERVGAPLALASVSLVGSVRALAVTNAAGEFSLWAGEEPGEVAVVAWSSGYTDDIARGRAGDPFALVLRRESVLLGKVVEPASGRPVARAKVRAGGPSGGLDPLVYTDTEGKFRISALPKGTYQPTARTELAYGQAKKAVRLEEGKLSPEVVIEAHPLVATPTPGTGSDAAGRDAKAVDAGTETTHGGVAPEVAGREGPPTPVPVVTDNTLRREAARRLARCGKDGTIELTADFVLDTGKLLNPSVHVTGRAAEDPRVAACAEKEARHLRLLPRKEPTSFSALVVKL